MKTKIVLLCLTAFSIEGFSQFKKDDALIGASASYNQSKNTRNNSADNYSSSENKNFNGNLRFGYFFKDNFALGLLGGYNKVNTKNANHTMTNSGEQIDNFTTKSKIYSIGVFTRLYKTIVNKKFAFFCQLDGSYQTGNSSGSSTGMSGGVPTKSKFPEGRLQGLIVGLHPGFVYFIRPRIGIEASFGTFNYNYLVNKSYVRGVKTSESSTGGVNMNFGLNTFFLGVSFYLYEKRS